MNESAKPSADGNTFAGGVRSMARNTKDAVILLRSGKWTLDQFDTWLDVVIGDKPESEIKSIIDTMFEGCLK